MTIICCRLFGGIVKLHKWLTQTRNVDALQDTLKLGDKIILVLTRDIVCARLKIALIRLRNSYDIIRSGYVISHTFLVCY